MPTEITMKDSLDLLNGFLKGVRKEVGEDGKDTSHMQTAAATPAAASNAAPTNDSPTGSTVSKELTQEATAVGGTVATVADNADGVVPAAAVPETNTGTVQMDADTPVQGGGQLGKVKQLETGQEQKVANLKRSIGLVTKHLKEYQAKEAAVAPATEGVDTAVAELAQKFAAASETAPAEGDLFVELEKRATEMASQVKADIIKGALLRVQDEISLKEAMELPSFPKEAAEAIESIGGPSAFLDKVAMDNPESILPAEVDAAEGEVGTDVPLEGAPSMEAPVEGDPAEGGDLPPMEVPVEGDPAEGGELSPEDLAMLEQLLAEAGVTPEDLEASQGDLDQLAAGGASVEESAAAMDALGQEQLAPEGDVEKLASSANPRVQICIDFLRERQASRK